MQHETETLLIFCKNNKKSQKFDFGAHILDIYETFQPILTGKPLCATVNNELCGLEQRIVRSAQVEFLDITSEAGRKVYMRSLTFVLCKAVADILPDCQLVFEAPVSKGYFFLLRTKEGTTVDMTLETAQRLKQRMRDIIDEGHAFHRIEAPTAQVAEQFRAHGLEQKARFVEGTGTLYSCYYRLCQTIDYYYGPLVPSTDYLDAFDLVKYYDGILLRVPREDGRLPDIVRQDKMLQAFRDDHKLEDIIGMSTIGELNELCRSDNAGDAIKVAEALQEKKIAQIADQIAARNGVRLVLIAGPSSSGKTTFSKRLSVQLMACGLTPRAISLDDYFVDRERTPRDASGDYDYEHIEAINLDLFNHHLNLLLQGEEIELPRYDFPTGKSVPSGNRLRLADSTILILEGIHALNPRLSEAVPAEATFKIYVSALTSIKLDNHNYIPTTDNRLLRRIVRDHKYRGTTAQQTIARWPSVRRGEDRWIFPYQENADVMFNSALVYELAVLRNHALPLLEAVRENCDEHTLACALTHFLRFFEPIPDTELPPTSLLREFLGGSSFRY